MNALNNKKIVVTGGAGFVGSNLVRTLAESGAQVVVLDDLFTGHLDNLLGVRYELVQGSVEDEVLVEECIQGADIVFHLASRNIIVSNQRPREDLEVNVRGSFNVFEASLKHKVARVIYTSTSSVYGEPAKLPVSEEDPKSFLNFYSASKFSAEVYAKTFYEVFGLPVTVLRYSNVYGTNQLPVNPYCGVIGKFIQSAVAGQPLKVHGTGEQTRDYTYIDDAVAATIAAAVQPAAVGNEYNIGTGEEASVNSIARNILDITGSASSIEYVNNRDIDNISRRCIDISKAQADLHYKPRFSIREGLQKSVEWFIQNFEGAAFGLATALLI